MLSHQCCRVPSSDTNDTIYLSKVIKFTNDQVFFDIEDYEKDIKKMMKISVRKLYIFTCRAAEQAESTKI